MRRTRTIPLQIPLSKYVQCQCRNCIAKYPRPQMTCRLLMRQHVFSIFIAAAYHGCRKLWTDNYNHLNPSRFVSSRRLLGGVSHHRSWTRCIFLQLWILTIFSGVFFFNTPVLYSSLHRTNFRVTTFLFLVIALRIRCVSVLRKHPLMYPRRSTCLDVYSDMYVKDEVLLYTMKCYTW